MIIISIWRLGLIVLAVLVFLSFRDRTRFDAMPTMVAMDFDYTIVSTHFNGNSLLLMAGLVTLLIYQYVVVFRMKKASDWHSLLFYFAYASLVISAIILACLI